MKKLIALTLTLILSLTLTAACAASDECFEIVGVVTAWEDAGEGAQEFTCTTQDGEMWAFYADAGDYSIGSLLRVRIWAAGEEIVDVEELGTLTTVGVAEFLR